MSTKRLNRPERPTAVSTCVRAVAVGGELSLGRCNSEGEAQWMQFFWRTGFGVSQSGQDFFGPRAYGRS